MEEVQYDILVEYCLSCENIFTANIPTSNQTLLASFANDTAILTSNKFSDIASQNLQLHLNKIKSWAKTGKLKLSTKNLHT